MAEAPAAPGAPATAQGSPAPAETAPAAGISFEDAWREASATPEPTPGPATPEPSPVAPEPAPPSETEPPTAPDVTEPVAPTAETEAEAPPPGAPPEPATESPTAEPSRRQRGEELRAQIRQELEAEYARKAAQQADEARRAEQARAEQARQADLQQAREQVARDTEILLSESATWEQKEEARQRSAPLLQKVRFADVQQRLRAEGASRAMADFWGQHDQQLRTVEGVTPELAAELMKLPTATEYASRLVRHGRALEQSAWQTEKQALEDRIAARDAEIAGLRGRLAGTVPSPEAQGGTHGSAPPTEIRTLADAWRIAQAREAGVA